MPSSMQRPTISFDLTWSYFKGCYDEACTGKKQSRVSTNAAFVGNFYTTQRSLSGSDQLRAVFTDAFISSKTRHLFRVL